MIRFLVISIFLAANSAFALTPQQEEAKRIVEQVLKFRKQTQSQKDQFTVWQRDMSSLTALECIRQRLIPKSSGLANAGKKEAHTIIENFLVGVGTSAADAQQLAKGGFEGYGSYASLSDQELAKLCPILASEGVKPLCTTDSVMSPADGPMKYNYPNTYLVMKSGRTQQVILDLKCSISSKEVKYKVGFGHEAVLKQKFVVYATDIEKLESPAITKWEPKEENVRVTAQKLAPGYQSPNPLMLASGPVRDVMVSNIVLKMKGLKDTFSWLLVVEPN